MFNCFHRHSSPSISAIRPLVSHNGNIFNQPADNSWLYRAISSAHSPNRLSRRLAVGTEFFTGVIA